MKKLNKKGFSLVELIIVIAIMAVLIGVLAPTYLGQVNKSKKGTDIQNAQELATSIAVKAAQDDALAKTVTSPTDDTIIFKAVSFGTDTDIAAAPVVQYKPDSSKTYTWYYSFDGATVSVGLNDGSATHVLYPTVDSDWNY